MSVPSIDPSAGLRKKKRFALLLLGVAFLLFLAGTVLEHRHPSGYWRALTAFAEAAMIGGLADWFAVVVLFRHPLGLRIPHTAIIPNSKDRIGESLADFVRDRFLGREQLVERIRQFDVAGHLVEGLKNPENAEKVAAFMAKHAPRLIGLLDSAELQRFVRSAVSDKARELDFAEMLGHLLEMLAREGKHQEALDGVLQEIGQVINAPEMKRAVVEKIKAELWSWLKYLGLKNLIAESAAEKLAGAAIQEVDDILSRPDHPFRQKVEAYLKDGVGKLQTDPEVKRKAAEIRDGLLSSPELGAWIADIWSDLLTWVKRDLENDPSSIRDWIKACMRDVGARLDADADMKGWINDGVVSTLGPLVDEYRDGVRDYIADQVRSWSAQEMSDQLERSVGSDLQYIRYSGTLVGGLIGLLLFATLEGINLLLAANAGR